MTTKKTNPKAAAKAYYSGKPLKDSLLEGGYSETQARKGRSLLAERKSLAVEFSKTHDRAVRKMAAMGQAYSPEMRADLVRGRLIDIALDDKSPSASVRSCELLGRDKAVNLFVPDNAVSLYNLQVPAEWADRYISTPTIDAIEVKDAVAPSLEDLPKTDGMITLSSFEPRPFELPRKLESGRVEIPKHMPVVEPETIPAVVEPPSPAKEYSPEDFETLK